MIFPVSYINTTKLSSEIRNGNFTPGLRTPISVGSDLEISYAINMSSGEPVELTYFDFVVCDALYTLYHNKRERCGGKITVSLGEILRTMSGSPAQTITEAKKRKLRESIDRLSRTEVFVDFRKEAERRKLKFSPGVCAGMLAPLSPVREGRYAFDGVMPLFDYAEQINQIMAFPGALLETDLPDTNEAIMIKHYLIKRLEMLRNPKNSFSQTKISYSWRGSERGKPNGLLAEIGIVRSETRFASSGGWRQKVTAVHSIVTHILDGFKARGYIAGYSVFPNPRLNIPGGIEIIPFVVPQPDGTENRIYASDPWELFPKVQPPTV